MNATPPPAGERDALAAIGGLSAKLGHDMGNAILPVRLRLEALTMRGVPEALSNDMRAIAACVEHLQRLATGLQLCSFEPDVPDERDSTNLGAWWADAETLLAALLPHGVALTHAFDADLPDLALSRQRLTLAFVHILERASDAIGNATQGTVHVGASRGPRPDTIALTVADNGVIADESPLGFPSDSRQARETGNSPVGFQLARGIVRPRGGTLEVASRAGEGTTITLVIPAAPATGDHARNAQRRANDE